MTQEQFIRNFHALADEEVDFFLGSGASIASGIPTGGDLIWEFKRSIYCSECEESTEKYKDLSLPSTQTLLQDYFDKKGTYPKQYASNEYSFYFEQCYCDPLARKRFIESIVFEREPSIGYLCLAEAIIQGKIKNIWTTNFDPLIENAIHLLNPLNNILVCSEANRSSVHLLNPQSPVVGKLHGDFRYDWLRNTEKELQQLEDTIKKYLADQLIDKQLVVIGYSGNDESIMSFLESNIDKPSFLSKGLLWAIKRDGYINPRVKALIERARKNNKFADFIEIDGFDQLMFSIYRIQNYNNDIIESKKQSIIDNRTLSFSAPSVDYFVKLNGFKSEIIPSCNVFKTDITSWKELRTIISDSGIIAALYNGHIYSFSSAQMLTSVFRSHILSSISYENIPEYILRKSDSVVIGMIYDLISKEMHLKGMVKYKKNRFFNPKSKQIEKNYLTFDAVEIAVSFIDGALYLNFLSTVHVLRKDKTQLSKDEYMLTVNRLVSTVYNNQYNDKLKFWEKLFWDYGRRIVFKNDGFILSFILPAISCGGDKRRAEWESLPAYTYSEPIMLFSDKDDSKSSINQLKGLVKYGPIDYSYSKSETIRDSVRLAVLAPNQEMDKILNHLNMLNVRVSKTGRDEFLPDYEGFEKVYHRALSVPTKMQKNICIGYNADKVLSFSPDQFLAWMKKGIVHFSQNAFDFDVLIIYIPRNFSRFRTAKSISIDFNLHDALKLYATEKGIKLQLIEEKSLFSSNPCKVMWGLSTSLYAKSTGVLWHPKAIQEDTAYIGISYAYSAEKGICIACSQLFDSTGTGIRMILRKIANLANNNPYMQADDARAIMTELREQYYRANPVNSLKRIVIHKTTPFISEEITGIMQAFYGIDDVELIQIQDYCSWRGIRFGTEPSKSADNFAVKRGLVAKLNQNSFLLWTHGCVIHPELAGKLNYYKGGRGIPAPLLIKRFAGKASGDILAKEILMLTKMNWNSGDNLYKNLPVTLDFAKVLARMSKQNEAMFDKAYDFRFFM